MKAVEFTFAPLADSSTVSVAALPELIAIFEELQLKASVLRTNPHIRDFLPEL